MRMPVEPAPDSNPQVPNSAPRFPEPTPGTREPTSPKARLLRVGKLLLQLLLTGVVTWFILKTVGLDLQGLRTLDLSLWNVRWVLVALSSLFLLGAYAYTAGLWGVMVREMGGYEVGLVVSLRVFFTANLARYVPGKLWQIAGLAYLARREGVPPGTATGAAVLGQAFALAGATLVGAGVLIGSELGVRFGGGWAAGALLVLLVAATFPAVFKGALALWFRVARAEVPGGFRPDQVFGVRWLGLYVVAWVLQGLAFWMLARGLGLDLAVFPGVAAYAAGYALGYVAVFAPAGIGVREGFLIAFLGPILGGPTAAALAVIARVWSTAMELLLASGLAAGYLRSARKGEG
jgi:glycosyltransferase 2 family protein